MGGTSGIGRETALAFFRARANVIAAGLETAEDLPSEIRKEIVDINNATAVEALFDGIPEVHALVNAVGIIRRDDEYKLDVFADVIEVNLTGTMRACMAARPKLLASRGSIVNFASMYSFFGGPRAPAYSASKGAIAQLTRSLAVAWAPGRHSRKCRCAGMDRHHVDAASSRRSRHDPRPFCRALRLAAGEGRRRSPDLFCF